jgi:hypothetical protein
MSWDISWATSSALEIDGLVQQQGLVCNWR